MYVDIHGSAQTEERRGRPRTRKPLQKKDLSEFGCTHCRFCDWNHLGYGFCKRFGYKTTELESKNVLIVFNYQKYKVRKIKKCPAYEGG